MHFGTSALDFSTLPYQEGVTKPNPAFLNDIGEQGMRDRFARFYTLLYKSPIANVFGLNEEEMQVAGQYSADFLYKFVEVPPTLTKIKEHSKCEKDMHPSPSALMLDYIG